MNIVCLGGKDGNPLRVSVDIARYGGILLSVRARALDISSRKLDLLSRVLAVLSRF